FVWFKDESGRETTGLIIRDIAEVRHAQQFLDESRKRLENVLIGSPQATVISNLQDGRIIDASDGFMELMGRTREEILQRTSIEVGMWADESDRSRAVELLQRNNSIQSLETKIRTKSGELRDVILSAQFLSGTRNVLTILFDITERKRLDRQLEEVLD